MTYSLFSLRTAAAYLQLIVLVVAFPSSSAIEKRIIVAQQTPATTYTDESCYTDLINGHRILEAASTAADDMTIAKCSAFCSKYKYFGVEYARECWCGDSLQKDQIKALATECSSPCSGLNQDICGAASRINVYTNTGYNAGTHATLAATPYIGCFVDSNPRVLPNNQLASDAMTAAACAVNCAGFTYFGTQWSRECWCGNTLPTVTAPEADCSMRCTGSNSETCGGSLRLSVYGPNANAPANTNTNVATVVPPATISNFAYQGCYSDNVPQRVLSGATKFDAVMTLEMCALFCGTSNYGLFGVEYAGECYCGNSLDTASTKKTDSECSMKCKGNSAQPCGDGNRLNVYALPTGSLQATTNPTGVIKGFSYQSCWIDNVLGRSLSDNVLFADDMTVEKCAAFCQGSKYFGLEFGKECYCGNTLGASKAPESDCSQHCVGDGKQFCGNGNRLSLYAVQSTQPSQPSTGACNANYHADLTSFSVSLSSDKDLMPWIHDITGNGATLSYVLGDQSPSAYKAEYPLGASGSDTLSQTFNVNRGATYEISVRCKIGGDLSVVAASLQVGTPGVGNGPLQSGTAVTTSADIRTLNDGQWQTVTLTFTPTLDVAKIYLKASISLGTRASYVVWDAITVKQTAPATSSVQTETGPNFVAYRGGTVSPNAFLDAYTDDIVAPAKTVPTILDLRTPGFDGTSTARFIYFGNSKDAVPFAGPAWRMAGYFSGRQPNKVAVMQTHIASINSNNCYMQILRLGQLIGMKMLDGCPGQWQTIQSLPFVPPSNSWFQMSIECPNQGRDASAWVDNVEMRPVI
ncbi:glyoxal oxidase precursor [Colletotrichum karsti]|uniref:Glyoxal oxidase n=1 Tax=Colletotrichum karsti TaxID=1095194 RepID=A0A9P6LF93_9PEZI|nr:glyoxal oxidase precursor [Colletotrichum karsti]KAF9873914.1 glyoxal oxidase precursor [Colletotrichum karsti]